MEPTSFDPVHDIQIAYRKVLNLMARPGQIDHFESLVLNAEEMNGFNSSFIVLAMMLLDAEVSFAWVPSGHENETKLLHQHTYSADSSVNTADFIFISQDATREEIVQAMDAAKKGSLLNPHCSATIILEVEKLAEEGEIVLSGPGIPGQFLVDFGTCKPWIEERTKINEQYPMGLDMILIDRYHRMMCLPRTTIIRLNKGSN